MNAQEVLYVEANNGLILRDNPDKMAQRIGKLEYGTTVKILEKTGLALQLLDNGKKLQGEWVKIKEVDSEYRQREGYVFNGYLTPQKINKRLKIHFEDFLFEIEELEIWDEEKELNKVQKDSARAFVELGDSPEGKFIRIKQKKYKKVEIFQRFENSITIMDEGPHCDLTEWEHYNSEWERLNFNTGDYTFKAHSYSQQDWNTFIPVDMNEFKEAVDEHCGERWFKLIQDVKSVHEYHSGVSMSRIFFKIRLTDKNDSIIQKIVVFELPMGC